jgi:hypothetical protein
MSKPRKLCIFCDGYPVTKEHMWPDWLRNYIPRAKSKFYSRSGILFRSRTDAKIVLHHGDPHSGRIRCVCRTCNSGWMSVLQSRTKPILIPLLRGDRYSLRKREQGILAAWVTMFAMVAEFRLRSGDLAAISKDERRRFMETQRPLHNWKIWIGAIGDENWKGRYTHTTLPVYSSGEIVKRTNNTVPIPNTQTTTFVVNKLYVHAISSSVVDLHKQQISTRLVQRIWPLTKTIKWPPRLLTGEDAEWISTAFFMGAVQRANRS